MVDSPLWWFPFNSLCIEDGLGDRAHAGPACQQPSVAYAEAPDDITIQEKQKKSKTAKNLLKNAFNQFYIQLSRGEINVAIIVGIKTLLSVIEGQLR